MPITLLDMSTWLQPFTLSYTELVAAILSFWCVWLAAKNNVLNWPVAMAGSMLYVVVFYRGALYSDAFLNVIFLLFQAFGWYTWRKSSVGDGHQSTSPRVAMSKELWPVFLVGAMVYFPWTNFVKSGSIQTWISPGLFQPPRFLYLDALLFILSICALYMQGKRWIQHWFLWIFVDVVYIPMYVINQNYITAILYFVYIPLAVKGYKLWRINLRARNSTD
jgi:nicotinamide mononucleotide transporter